MKKDFEVRFYESLLKENPNFVGALVALGDTYTKRKFYHKGLEIDQRLASLRPEDPVIRYNLACSLCLTGLIKESLKSLKLAVLLGYDDFSYILKDRDLKKLRDTAEFKDFFSKLERFSKENV